MRQLNCRRHEREREIPKKKVKKELVSWLPSQLKNSFAFLCLCHSHGWLPQLMTTQSLTPRWVWTPQSLVNRCQWLPTDKNNSAVTDACEGRIGTNEAHMQKALVHQLIFRTLDQSPKNEQWRMIQLNRMGDSPTIRYTATYAQKISQGLTRLLWVKEWGISSSTIVTFSMSVVHLVSRI